MDKIIQSLAYARKQVDEAAEVLDQAREALHNTPEYKAFQAANERYKETRACEADQKRLVTGFFVEHYDGENKKPHPAVIIGEYTVPVYDEADALRYAVEGGMLPLLKLNKSQFEKLAKTGICDFVEIEKEPRARISSDLSAYL
jgi:hypothetical protein